MPEEDLDLTAVLGRAVEGEPGAADELAFAVEAELRKIAASLLRQERADHTLQATALANEVWLWVMRRLDTREGWPSRRAFYRAVARAMRHVLVDHARKGGRDKRGGNWNRVPMDPGLPGLDGRLLGADDVLDLHDALDELLRVDARAAHVVELRIFAGLTIPETANVLEVSHGTVESDFRTARAWLRGRLDRGHGDGR